MNSAISGRVRRGVAHGGVLVWAVLLGAATPLPGSTGMEIGAGFCLTYQVVTLEKAAPSRFKINETAEDVRDFTECLGLQDRDGFKKAVLQREERLDTGTVVDWTFQFDPQSGELERVEKGVTSPSGKPVRGAWVDYRDPMFRNPPFTAHIDTIPYTLKRLPLAVGNRDEFYLTLSMDFKPWRIFASVVKTETITVPAGAFPCYMIQLAPDYESILGSWAWGAKLLKPLVPDYYFWIETEEPHRLIRFTGKFGPNGSAPLQAWELTRVGPLSEGVKGKK
jgi:hypothetical protein